MDLTGPNSRFDILQIYQKYCDIVSRNTHVCGDDESRMANSARDELVELLKVVESWVNARNSIYDELRKLMSQLGVMEDSMKLSRFYDFVFFTCRENGQKNISVTRAVTAWKLVLVGRFRLLNQWCDFVQKYQRHNISEDTWRQVLAFSWCVHENLEGYDPQGAWPVLIDDFVEFMYRVNGSNDNFKSQTSTSDDSLPGFGQCPGFKRKMMEEHELKSTGPCSSSKHMKHFPMFKKLKQIGTLEGKSLTAAIDVAKHSSSLKPAGSLCAAEGCLSKGFAGLFTTGSSLQVDRNSYT